MVIAVGGKLQAEFPRHRGQEFSGQETGIRIAHPVIFKTAIPPSEGSFCGRRQFAGLDEDADGHRHFSCRDHGFQKFFFTGIVTILLDVDTGWLGTVILCGDEDPSFPLCARENDAVGK